MNELALMAGIDGTRSDLIAFFQSYAAELTKDNLPIACVPIIHLPIRTFTPQQFDPVIDWTYCLNLVRYQLPPCENQINKTRWPFFVNTPLQVGFFYGDQWWIYRFSPGKLYENREFSLGGRTDIPIPEVQKD